MKVILTFLPALVNEHEFQTLDTPPLALYVLAAVLKESEHEITIIDPCEYLIFNGEEDLEEKCISLLKERGALASDFIGFSTNTFNWGITKTVVNDIKEINDKIVITLGGLHPSIFDKYVLQSTRADFVLRGEGEEALPLLLNTLKQGGSLEKIDGLTYRKNDEIIRNKDSKALDIEFLEHAPMPEYQLIPQPNPYTAYPIESSRGCAFSCAFCSIQHRHNWRGFTAENVLKRVEYLYGKVGNRCKENLILFVDDCFTINTERAVLIMRKLFEAYRMDLKYFIEVRISNILKNNLLSRLPLDMISSMQIGVECGYDDGLKKINKEITISQLIQALNLIKINGYASKCFLSFIIGFPWESETEINLTLDTVQQVASIYHVTCNINWLYLLPSDLWSVRRQYDILVDEDVFDNPFWLNSRDLFQKVHPKISDDVVTRIETRIKGMHKNGLPVLFNGAPDLVR